MPLQSDISIDVQKFQPEAISDGTKKFNDHLIEMGKKGPNWWEVGIEKYRQMRWNGETWLPRPTVIESGMKFMIPSRDLERQIPCRVFHPENGTSKGIFYHIHGGGWALMSEEYQDPYLKRIADENILTVVSVGYRLAPEHPYPAGPEDCYDVGEWLVDNAREHFSAELSFVGGESAGGHLSVLTSFHLLRTRPQFEFRGLVLHFGCYELAGWLPQVYHFDKPLVLHKAIMDRYIDILLPGTTESSRRDPSVSPLYTNLFETAKLSKSGKLPPALFTVGTADCLMDDTVVMGTKWMMTGADTVVKVYPGAPHGFTSFSEDVSDAARDGLRDMMTFLKERSP